MQGFISFCDREAIRNTSDKDNRGFHVSFVNWRKAICLDWNRFSVSLNSPKSIRMQGFISFCDREYIRNTSDKDNRGFHVSFVNLRKAICIDWNRFSVSLNSPKSIRMQWFISFCDREAIRTHPIKIIEVFTFLSSIEGKRFASIEIDSAFL